jgi:hypothetical protein
MRGLPVSLAAVALILGVIGLVRAVVEFGTPGAIAFAKLILGPAVVVFLFFVLSAGRRTGDFPGQALKFILIGVAVLTGMACAASALCGVAWLVTK